MASNAYHNGLAAVGPAEYLSGVIRAMLLTDSYTPNKDHDFVNDVSAAEVANGSYARQTLANKAVTVVDASDHFKYVSDTIDFGALTGVTFRYMVLYRQVGGDDSTPANDNLLCVLDFGSNQTANGAGTTVSVPANGWIHFDT